MKAHESATGLVPMDGHVEREKAKALAWALDRVYAVFDPNTCAWCFHQLDDPEFAAVRDPVVIQLGRLCRPCAARQEQVR